MTPDLLRQAWAVLDAPDSPLTSGAPVRARTGPARLLDMVEGDAAA